MVDRAQIIVQDELALQRRNCPICGNAPFKVVGKGYDYDLRITHHIFEYRRCRRCGLVFLNFQPVQLFKAYKERIWDDKRKVIYSSFLKKQLYFRNRRLIKHLSRLAEKKPNFRLLDIGSGRGDIFIVLREKFPKGIFYSVDLTKEVVDPRIKHYKGYFENCDFGGEKFDVITSQHNIEHVYSPLDYLKKASLLLDDSGFMFIATPNVDALEFSIFKRKLYCGGYDIPRHLSLFNEQSFRMLTAKVKDIQIESIGNFFTIFHWVSLVHHFIYDKFKNEKINEVINYNNLFVSIPFYFFELIRYCFGLKTGVLEIILTKRL